jgi:hypothetical protein
MPHFIGRLSASASSHHSLFSAAFITNIAESDFRHAQENVGSQFLSLRRDGPQMDLQIAVTAAKSRQR